MICGNTNYQQISGLGSVETTPKMSMESTAPKARLQAQMYLAVDQVLSLG